MDSTHIHNTLNINEDNSKNVVANVSYLTQYSYQSYLGFKLAVFCLKHLPGICNLTNGYNVDFFVQFKLIIIRYSLLSNISNL